MPRLSGRLLAACGLYAALATLITAPALSDPTHLALGAPGNDVWNHVWGHWWFARSLAEGHLPTRADLLNWPDGGSLWYIDSFGAFATLPIQWLAGPVAAYNASIWGNLVLCGLGAHLLARRVCGSDLSATVAGGAYLLTPHLIAQVYNGISESLAAGWLPLAVLAALRAREAPTAGRIAVAGITLGVTAVANAYYVVFAALMLAVLALSTPGPALRTQLAAALAGLTVAGATAAGPLLAFRSTLTADDALVHRDPAFVWTSLLQHNMTDLVALAHPGRYYSPDLRALFNEDLLIVVYLGAAVWLPALAVRDRAMRAWWVIAVAFIVLSLGPFLYVNGAYVNVSGGMVPLPFYVLYRWVPGFTAVSHAYRFTVGASLALSILAGSAILRLPARHRGALATLLMVARAMETLLACPAVFPLPVARVSPPAILAELDDGAILDLPISLPPLARAELLMGQLVRAHPVPFGLNDPLPDGLRINHYTRYIAELERRRLARLPARLPLLDLAAAQADLRARGLRWIVVHQDAYGPEALGRVRPFLELTATLYAERDGVLVYANAPPGVRATLGP